MIIRTKLAFTQGISVGANLVLFFLFTGDLLFIGINRLAGWQTEGLSVNEVLRKTSEYVRISCGRSTNNINCTGIGHIGMRSFIRCVTVKMKAELLVTVHSLASKRSQLLRQDHKTL